MQTLLQVGANRYAAKRWKDCRALVIDEISMIDAGESSEGRVRRDPHTAALCYGTLRTFPP
jgi:ATP-dependent exoDNAse (exonuclease V) alpha subunit